VLERRRVHAGLEINPGRVITRPPIPGCLAGLDPRNITQRVRLVAEVAVTTAFEPSEQKHQPNAHGDNDHG